MEREERDSLELDEQESKKNAAEGDEEPQGPEQDETDDTRIDTDEHSDAPGPFGTG